MKNVTSSSKRIFAATSSISMPPGGDIGQEGSEEPWEYSHCCPGAPKHSIAHGFARQSSPPLELPQAGTQLSTARSFFGERRLKTSSVRLPQANTCSMSVTAPPVIRLQKQAQQRSAPTRPQCGGSRKLTTPSFSQSPASGVRSADQIFRSSAQSPYTLIRSCPKQREGFRVHRNLWDWIDQPYQPPPETTGQIQESFTFA